MSQDLWDDNDVDDDVVEEAPALVFPTLDAWVELWLAPTYRRKVGSRTGDLHWEAEWWRSGEAIVRLEALWRAWESLRLDPATGMSVWFRDHADYHLGILMGEHGPFTRSKTENKAGDPLPCTPAPRGMFTPA